MSSSPATELARAAVEMLLRLGVEQVVIAPGSRNAPLGFALAAAADSGRITLLTRIDERAGAFTALGAAKASRRPVAVVTTSGTAVANLHPALAEAAHAGVRLVAVSADRPARLRGTMANQTTDQVGVFGALVPTVDVADVEALRAAEPAVAARLAGADPVHLNLQFTEPLIPPDDAWQPGPAGPGQEPGVAVTTPLGEEPLVLPRGPRTVVVAGDDAGPAARRLAESAGWPLLAEPTSGARNGASVIRTYRLLLAAGWAERVERVVVCGRPTLSRPVQSLLARSGIEVIAERLPGAWPARPHPVTSEFSTVPQVAPTGTDDPTWTAQWQQADRLLSQRLDAEVFGEEALNPYQVAATVHRAVPAGGLLYVGASNPIRDLDLMAGAYPVGERRRVLANRGLAGIDGVISSAIGAALARAARVPGQRAILYLGDVSAVHDLTGLLLGRGQEQPQLTVVIAHDDGGSIFATLEQGDPRYGAHYEALFGTPHGVDFAAACQAFGVPHWRVESAAELAHALASPSEGIDVVEARLRRDDRRVRDLSLRALAETADLSPPEG